MLQILTTPRREVGVDSSALSDLFASGEGAVDAFAGAIERRAARVVLCDYVLGETLGMGDSEKSHARAKLLGRLAERLGGNLVLAAPLHDIFSSELAFARNPTIELFGTPHVPLGEAEELLRFFATDGFPEWLAENREAIRAQHRVEQYEIRDRAIRAELQTRFPDATPEDLLSTINDPVLGRWMLELILDEDAEVCTRVASRPSEFRALTMYAAYAHLNAVGAATRGASRGSYNWLTSGRGDWSDARIAATYSYCTWTVTADRGLRRRLEFLAQRGRTLVVAKSIAFVSQGEEKIERF